MFRSGHFAWQASARAMQMRRILNDRLSRLSLASGPVSSLLLSLELPLTWIVLQCKFVDEMIKLIRWLTEVCGGRSELSVYTSSSETFDRLLAASTIPGALIPFLWFFDHLHHVGRSINDRQPAPGQS